MDGIIYNWDINSGIPFSIDSVGVYGIGEDNISTGRYLTNGENILLSNEGGEVFLLQKDEGHFPQKRRFFYSPTPVNAFDLSSDGSFIISGDDEGVVKIFQTDQNKNSALIKLNGFGTKIHDIRESTDNNRLLIEGDQNINIWDIHNPEQPHLLYRNIRDSSFFGYEISPNGKWAIVKDSLNNLGGIYDLETKELNFSKYDLSRYSGKFSPSSNYFIQEKDSFFLLHDLERSKTKFLFRSGSEDYFALSNDDGWMISKSEHNEEIDSVRLWFLNGKADTLMKETKKLSKKFSALQLVSGSKLIGLSKGNLIDSVFLFTLQKDGTIREEASEMLDNANSVSVSEQGNYLLTYNSELPQDDNSYYVTFPELWTIKNNSLSTKSFLFTGTTPIREAKFSHSGKWLITIGGEESIVEIWRLDADTLKLVLKPTGPFSGFENIWDFEFSPNDNCVVFYSTFFGNTPYVVKLDEFPINPVGVALKNDGQGTRGLAFSPNSEYLYVYNLNRPGLSSIIKNGKFSVNVFDLTHPESRPSELYRSSVGQAYSSQLIDNNKYFFLATDKEAIIQLVDFSILRKKLEQSLGGNFTWNEWSSIARDAEYSLVYDSLPPDYSVFIYVLNYIVDLHSRGNIDEMNFWILRLENYLMQAKDPEIYNTISNFYRYKLSEYSLSLEAAKKALYLNPGEGSYKKNRGLAYWLLGKFKEAEQDIESYLNWYRNDYKGEKDTEFEEEMQSYLDRIKNKKMPQ